MAFIKTFIIAIVSADLINVISLLVGNEEAVVTTTTKCVFEFVLEGRSERSHSKFTVLMLLELESSIIKSLTSC